jgi:hypothetical protein
MGGLTKEIPLNAHARLRNPATQIMTERIPSSPSLTRRLWGRIAFGWVPEFGAPTLPSPTLDFIYVEPLSLDLSHLAT